jgi:membrane protein involved in colicin uptake
MTYGGADSQCSGRWDHFCCNCYWDGEDERDEFLENACKQCKKRRAQWGGGTTQTEFAAAEAKAKAEAQAKRKQEEAAKQKAAAEAKAKAEAEAKGKQERQRREVVSVF